MDPEFRQLHEYAHPREARIGIRDYLQFYNDRRVHQALDYRRPAHLYFGRTDHG